MSPAAKPLPVMSPESKPFWEGCRRRELLVPRCENCLSLWFPPSALCPECWSEDWKWEKCDGRGTVFSYVVYQRVYHPGWADEIPYAIAVVELEEGIRLTSNIVGCDPHAIRCGMEVVVDFEDVTEEVTLPRFRPV